IVLVTGDEGLLAIRLKGIKKKLVMRVSRPVYSYLAPIRFTETNPKQALLQLRV
ncbi:unnamed protein product, partial [marine sediment metagenome]